VAEEASGRRLPSVYEEEHMVFGTRFAERSGNSASHPLRLAGVVLIGSVLAAGSLGGTIAQDATPDASPQASPAASPVVSLISLGFPATSLLSEVEIEGDSTTLAVSWDGEALEVIPDETELRPTVILQTTNASEQPIEFAVLQTPEGFDPTTVSLADFDGTFPEGVTPIGAYSLEAAGVDGAVFEDLAAGSYLVITSNGQSFPFVLSEPAALDVPDIFATPGATPAT